MTLFSHNISCHASKFFLVDDSKLIWRIMKREKMIENIETLRALNLKILYKKISPEKKIKNNSGIVI